MKLKQLDTWQAIYSKEDVLYVEIVETIKQIFKDVNQYNIKDSSLISGNSGKILFNTYYSKLFEDQTIYDNNIAELENLLNKINEVELSANLFYGISGILFLYTHLLNIDYLKGKIDLVELDFFLNNSQKSLDNNYDLLTGFIGIGVYFIERKFSGNVEPFIENTLLYIERLVKKLDENTYYWVDNYSNNKNDISLGLAHGMPSIIIFLTKIFNTVKLKDRVKPLIESAVNFLLKFEMKNSISQFSNFIDSCSFNPDSESRLGWCYGDLSVSYAIYEAGIKTKNTSYIKKAIKLFTKTTSRDISNAFTEDACFCHGTAGIAHIYNRMYHNTGNTLFRERAKYWIGETLKYKHNDGIGGFKYLTFDHQTKTTKLVNKLGLLEGALGIGLVLISAISDIEPEWDRCFLLS